MRKALYVIITTLITLLIFCNTNTTKDMLDGTFLPRPSIKNITVIDKNTVKVEYETQMESESTSNLNNYDIIKGSDEKSISLTNLTFNQETEADVVIKTENDLLENEYIITIKNVKTKNYREASSGGLMMTFTTVNMPPYIRSVTPDDLSKTSVMPTITIEFSKEMDKDSIFSSFSLKLVSDSGSSSTEISTTGTSSDNKSFVFTPQSALDYNTFYSINISVNALDKNGLNLNSSYKSVFITEASSEPPVVSSILPTDRDVRAEGTSPIIVNFSKEMNQTSVEDAIDLSTLDGTSIEITKTWLGNTLQITPVNGFTPFADYQFVVGTSATDIFGNNIACSDTYPCLSKFKIKGDFNISEQISLVNLHSLSKKTFNYPFGIKVDDVADTIYVADNFNHRIIKMTYDGEVLLTFGQQGTNTGEFNSPKDIAIDGFGDLYITDTSNCRIQKFNSNGNFLLTWGIEGSASGEFKYPSGIDIDGSNTVYVADRSNSRIQTFDANGNYISMITGSLYYPEDVIAHNNGLLYVVNSVEIYFPTYSIESMIYSIDPTTSAFTLLNNTDITHALSIDTDSTGLLYVTDMDEDKVKIFNTSGTLVSEIGTSGYNPGEFNRPLGISLSEEDIMFVTDSLNSRIQKFNQTLNVEKEITGPDLLPDFSSPEDIYSDSTGNFYVADFNGRKIHKFTSTGTHIFTIDGSSTGVFENPITVCTDSNGDIYAGEEYRIIKLNSTGGLITTWGTNGSSAGEFNTITDIELDSNENLFVLEAENARIQKFTLSGTFLAMYGGIVGTATGEFNMPRALSIDSNDYIYIADSQNDRIQKFNPQFQFITSYGSEGNGPGELRTPNGVDVDDNGRIYIADASNYRIQILSSNGMPILQFGTYGTNSGQFNNLRRICVNNGKIYTTDGSNNVVNILEQTSSYSSSAVFEDVELPFQYTGNVNSIKVKENNIFISTPSQVIKTDMLFNYIDRIGCSESYGQSGYFNQAYDLAFDSNNNIYVADKDNSRIQKFSSSGYFLSQWGLERGFYFPEGIAIDSNDAVYIADSGNNRVAIFNTDGTSSGQDWTSIENPSSIMIDNENQVYVTERGTANRIVVKPILSGSGTSYYIDTLVKSNSETETDMFSSPAGITTDGNGNFFVADTDNDRVIMFTSFDDVTEAPYKVLYTIEAPDVSIDAPKRVEIDGNNNLYVTDETGQGLKVFKLSL